MNLVITIFFRIINQFNLSNNAASKLLAFISFLFDMIHVYTVSLSL